MEEMTEETENHAGKSVEAIRIVTMDYYLAKPIQGLDPCYSELQNTIIKMVPVIRIFGSNKEGKKVCAHVHGVFPYVYVPYVDDDTGNIGKFMQQLASSLDKAINISLGGGTRLHVFRVTLVKGTPFYGYHKSEETFLRIHLFNPGLVRRVANLLLNGAVMGRSFQPHESHIPYILQFLIDHNLYGMSQLYVPAELLVYRTAASFADGTLKKLTSTPIEIDLMSIHILNRILLAQQTSSGYGNPGISSIWEDEKIRRGVDHVSELEPPQSQIRPYELVTESDTFYRDILRSRVKLLDASDFQGVPGGSGESHTQEDLDGTIVDEEIALGLSQRLSDTLQPEDLEMLAILKDLEEDAGVDLDSTLAHLTPSQELGKLSQPKVIRKEEDSDDDDLDFTMVVDELFERSTDHHIIEKMDQLDGLHDLPQKRVTRNSRNINQSLSWHNLTNPPNLGKLNILVEPFHNSPPPSTPSSPSTSQPLVILSTTSEETQNISSPEPEFLDDTLIAETLDDSMNLSPIPKTESPVVTLETSNYREIKEIRNLEDEIKKLQAKHFKGNLNLDEPEEDTMIQSFYEKTLTLDDENLSDDLFDSDSSYSPPVSNKFPSCVVIEPQTKTPSFDEVAKQMHDFGIPEQETKTPIYKDFKDVTKKKEIGRNVLHIGSDSLKAVPELPSSLTKLRQEMIEEFVDTTKVNIDEYLAGEARITIVPVLRPPTVREAKVWIQARNAVQKIESQDPDPCDVLSSESKDSHKSKFDFSISSANVSTLEKSETYSSQFLSYSKRKKMRLSLAKRTRRLQDKSSQDSMDDSMAESVNRYLDQSQKNLNLDNSFSFNLSATRLEGTQNFKRDLENLKSVNAKCEYTYLTIMNLELHVSTRDELNPDPTSDAVQAVFYCINNDVPEAEPQTVGIIVQDLDEVRTNVFRRSDFKCDILVCDGELKLYESFLDVMQKWDPDILSGYEIERGSWGYLIDRGAVLGLDMLNLLSRILPSKEKVVVPVEEDPGAGADREYENDIQIRGRILLNVWRLMRHEIALTSYSFENICYHILHHRQPLHSFKSLTDMWRHGTSIWIVVDALLFRTKATLDILSALDLIGRTCEMAKLFGIQFFEVLSRGSQFRVESMMQRLTKPQNYVSVSPSPQQRATMKAPEYIPLILEPQSRLYSDPVIVLDFQSLYPSVIIGYNYCFSTCLGRVQQLGTSESFEFGATTLKVPQETLKKIIDGNHFTVSPCGVAFVTPEIRKGILPQMLKEILDTRLMVKQSMKVHKENKVLQRVLHSRQLGLKLIANVTYGYTAANFSGRMPCVEVGDSVVSKGRETLEKAIRLVEENQTWKVKVVYGDTDSLFVLVPGRDRKTAFKIGQEIVDAVATANPTPIKLKLEKVYQPCILQTKKRYVGYMYETPDQTEPVYEAKGIETVRRDGVPAVQKLLEKSLRILFETFDVSSIKRYLNRQFTKILNNEMSIQELTFAREFRGFSGYKDAACVPALELTRMWIQTDPRAVPLSGERVPFVVANGPPGLPLIRLVRSPYELLADKGLKINSMYYITKVIIPPLNRCLLLIGADVREWFDQLPRKIQLNGANVNCADVVYKKSTIAQYFATANCLTGCGRQAVAMTKSGLCLECVKNPQRAVVALSQKVYTYEKQMVDVESICQSCCGRATNTSCISLSCPVLYKLNRVQHEFSQVAAYRKLIEDFF